VGISYYHLCKIIVEYQKVKKLPIFKNGNPSKKWYKAFLKRWDKKISERKSQNLPRNRAECLTEECINNFYELVKNKYESIESTGAIIKPENVYYVDESGFNCDTGPMKVICKKGSKNPSVITGNKEKTMYTVSFSCNAKGDYLPPYILFKAQHCYTSWCAKGPENAGYNVSNSGWMEDQQFYDWLNDMFLKYTNNKGK
jgi:hypothetical protein